MYLIDAARTAIKRQAKEARRAAERERVFPLYRIGPKFIESHRRLFVSSCRRFSINDLMVSF
jgi:hypothetical protein